MSTAGALHRPMSELRLRSDVAIGGSGGWNMVAAPDERVTPFRHRGRWLLGTSSGRRRPLLLAHRSSDEQSARARAATGRGAFVNPRADSSTRRHSPLRENVTLPTMVAR